MRIRTLKRTNSENAKLNREGIWRRKETRANAGTACAFLNCSCANKSSLPIEDVRLSFGAEVALELHK
jgi:hypothetical protein